MRFSQQRPTLENALEAVRAAQQGLDRVIEWTKINDAVVRHVLKDSDNAKLLVPDDDLRLCLSEQYAQLQIAQENLMLALGRKHFFSTRPFYAPIDPNDSEEFTAKIWAKLWPDRRYPHIDQLTPEQRYFAFGPDGDSAE